MLLQKSIQGAVIILVIIVMRALFINKLPKRTFVILWAVAVFCLLFPFSLKSRMSVYTLVEENGIYSSKWGLEKKTENVSAKNGTGEKEKAETEEKWQGANTLRIQKSQDGFWWERTEDAMEEIQQELPQTAVWTLVYVLGVFLCAGYFGIAYFRCCQEFSTSLPVENEASSQWLKAHTLKRKIAIRQLSGIKAPLTYGILSPVILLPKNIKWECKREMTEGAEGTSGRHLNFIPQELRLCLEHEFVHIKRLDGVTKLVLTAALCLHWFNPLVWAMYIFANRDLELSCDEAVVRTLGENVKSAYARTLIRMEETKSGLIPLGSNFSKNAIEERITAVMKIKKSTMLTAGAAVVLVILVTLTFATSAADERNAADVEINRTVSGRNLEKLAVSADYFYMPLDGGRFIVFESDGLEAVNSYGTDERVYLGTVGTEGSLRTYIRADTEEKQSKYFHLTVNNHTEKEISGIEYSMLAYDKEGRPLEVYWTFIDSEKPASYECTVEEQCRILPEGVYDKEGGWSIYDQDSSWGLIDLSSYGKDYKVEYVLSCIIGITFEDGTIWSNPDYETWREECYGKKVPYSAFTEYGRQEYEIFGTPMEN